MHLIPALINNCGASGNGKKASDAATKPLSLIFLGALLRANLVESILLICPAPIPSVFLFFAITIALDLTCLQTLKLNIRSLRTLLETL